MGSSSAAGLFRATGNKRRPVATRDLLTGEYRKDPAGLEREKDEFYPTPAEPTRAFLHAELERLRELGTIWEPAAGDGAMVRELRAAGLDVMASDLVDRGCGAEIRDFFAFSRGPRAIVTNPPFNLCGWGTPANHRDGLGKARWIKHALDVIGVEYMALLLNWNWAGAAGLGPLWDRHPPARVYLMRWKVDFTRQGSPPQLNCWVVWERGHKGPPQLLMLDRKDARQSEIFGEVSP